MNSSVIVFPGSNCDRDISVALEKFILSFEKLITKGIMEKKVITTKLDKKVLAMISKLLFFFSFCLFLLIVKPFFFKYFFISKIEKLSLVIIILQLLLLPQVNNDTKGFERLA